MVPAGNDLRVGRASACVQGNLNGLNFSWLRTNLSESVGDLIVRTSSEGIYSASKIPQGTRKALWLSLNFPFQSQSRVSVTPALSPAVWLSGPRQNQIGGFPTKASSDTGFIGDHRSRRVCTCVRMMAFLAQRFNVCLLVFNSNS
jgi:hypothetical protein